MAGEFPLQVPAEWRRVSLEEISEFITKGTTPTTLGFGWAEAGILFLRSECVSEDGFIRSGAQFISPDAHSAMARSEVRPGDLLITITGNVGRVCLLPQTVSEANINQHIARVRIKPDAGAEQAFVCYQIRHPLYRQYFERIVTGLAYPQISLKQVREAVVALPSLFEQRKIAAILSSIDDTLEKTHAVIDQLDVVKKGLLRELLVRGVPERHSRHKATLLGQMPDGWECAALASVIERIDTGWSPLCDSQPAQPGEWGVLKVSSVTWGEFRPEENKRLPASVDPRPEAEVREGDLLVSRANTKELVGRSVLVKSTPPRLMASDKLLRLRLRPQRAMAAFLNYVLSSDASRAQIEDAATGSSGSMKNISQEKLRGILIPLPPVDEQKAITAVLDATSERIHRERSSLNGLHELRVALLRILLSGEVRIERAPEEAA